jgi:tryprostatin B 6-hydroxylase
MWYIVWHTIPRQPQACGLPSHDIRNRPFDLEMSVRLQAIFFFFGTVLHILLFSRGEWDRHAPRVVAAYIFLCITIFTAFVFSTNSSFVQCIVGTYNTSLALTSGLFTSIVTYRLLFHPLRSFPAPLAARISSFWVFRENWPDLRFYVKLRKLHDHYGDFVRISKSKSHCRFVRC